MQKHILYCWCVLACASPMASSQLLCVQQKTVEEQHVASVQQEKELDTASFFDDAPKNMDESQKLSKWQAYIAKALDCGISAYSWVSQKTQAIIGWLSLQYQKVTNTASNKHGKQ